MTAPPVTIRSALPSERPALQKLQRRSSMHEPKYRAQLAAHPDAIELPAHFIAAGVVRVAVQDCVIVGFATLLAPRRSGCELDELFVEPDRMRHAVGRGLIDDATRIARKRGAPRIEVIANPQALTFYQRVGFTTSGEAKTRFGMAPRMSLLLDA